MLINTLCCVQSSWNTFSHYIFSTWNFLFIVKDWHSKRMYSCHSFIAWWLNRSRCQWSSIYCSYPDYHWEWEHTWQLAERHKWWYCWWRLMCQSGRDNCTQYVPEWTLSTSSWQWLQDESAREQFQGIQLSFVLVEVICSSIHQFRQACYQVSWCSCNVCSIWAYLESSCKSPHCQEK